MRKLQLALLLLLPVCLIYFLCCTPVSIHEFYTENDIVFEPTLLGKWIDENDSGEPASMWVFSRFEDSGYLLLYAPYEFEPREGEYAPLDTNTVEGQYVPVNPHKFHATLFELDSSTYLDIFPYYDSRSAEPSENIESTNGLVNVCSVRGHTLWRVEQTETGVDLWILDKGVVDEYWSQHPESVEADYWGRDYHDDVPEGIVLFSDTPELQQFIAEISSLENVFGKEALFNLVPLADSAYSDMIAEPQPVPESDAE